MISRFHFNIFHSDRLCLLVEVQDVDQPPFLEDIEESHNAFSIQPPLQGSRSKTNNVESWDYRGHLYLLLWHVHTRAYPIPLHDDVNSYMYACGPSPLKRFGIDVWDILHIQPRFLIQQNASRACPRSDSSIFIDPAGVYIEAYPMHCHVRVFWRMMAFGVAFSLLVRQDIPMLDVYTGAFPLTALWTLDVVKNNVWLVMNDYVWCFQLFDFNHMCSYDFLTWYRYPRLGHTPLSDIVLVS